MADALFPEAVQKITQGPSSIGDLISECEQFQRNGRPDLAEQLYRIWVRFNSDSPHIFAAYFNCAALISDTARAPDAIELLNASIAANPSFNPAYINLGIQQEKLGLHADALASWASVVERLGQITGENISYRLEALRQISRVQLATNEQLAADRTLRASLDTSPHQRDMVEQHLAQRLSMVRFPIIEPFGGVTREKLIAGISPLSMLAYSDDPILQYAVAGCYTNETILNTVDPGAIRRHGKIEGANQRPLRIGYLSSDLRDHAIGYLMVEFFEVQDRSVVETFVYDCGPPSTSAITDRIARAVDGWVSLNEMSDAVAAERIAADRIDILIDINGHTRFARTGMLALRPAPVIVNWLGYPGTMATAFHDYIVADDWIIPPEFERYYSEDVLRLPCYQPNDRKRTAYPAAPTRAEAGLPDDAFVFACFNGAQKYTRHHLERWAQILAATPDSVLWLLDCNTEARANIATLLRGHGIDESRIVFAAQVANPLHMSRIPLADLFLDTVPYGAHTTASDALWMGLPVLTASGRCFASRVCGSLVRSAGIPELICADEAAYVRTAIELYHDRTRLLESRQRLAASRDTCDLFNVEKLTRALYDLFHHMVERHNAGPSRKCRVDNPAFYRRVGGTLDHDGVDFGALPNYAELYTDAIARQQDLMPIQPDGRFWLDADLNRLG